MFIDRDSESYVGLFGHTIDAEIRNLTIKNCDVTGSDYVGGLVGRAINTNIVNCYITGKVEGVNIVGGLAGAVSGESHIINSYSSADVSGIEVVGGLVGFNDNSNILQCYATGNMSTTNGNIGGLVGINDGSISNSYATGNVSGGLLAGGLVGFNTSSGSVLNCYATGDVSVDFCEEISGLVAKNVGSVTNSYAVGTMIENGGIKSDEYTRKDMTKATMQVGINSGEDSQIGLKFRTLLSGLETISSRIGTSSVLDTIDGMISEVSNKQTEFGAAQNRLESALESISVNYENLVSSRSTLRDADIAKESSKYIQQQILQQAAATLLATANQSPSIALQLI